MPAEALLDSLVQATGVPENFGGARPASAPPSCPTPTSTSEFLNLFGKPQRMEACECERDNSSNMLQALHFINGNSILGRVQNPGGRPAQLLKQKLTDEELITELYLWSLARRPSAKELEVGLDFLKSYGDQKSRRGAGHDVGSLEQQGLPAGALERVGTEDRLTRSRRRRFYSVTPSPRATG